MSLKDVTNANIGLLIAYVVVSEECFEAWL